MSHSTMIEAIASNPEATARRTDDGYFGWTDRYGVRPSFFPERDGRRRNSRPYFIGNY